MSIFNMMLAGSGGGGTVQKATSASANTTKLTFLPITQIPKEWVLVRITTSTNVQTFAGMYKKDSTYYRIRGVDMSAASTTKTYRTVITTLSETLTGSTFQISASSSSFVSGASYILYYI